MAFAGQLLVAGRIPNERIATEVVTADSSNFTTTEVVLITLSDVPVVSGRTYRVRAVVQFQAPNPCVVAARIRFDDTSGTQLTNGKFDTPDSAGVGYGDALEVEFTAASTSTVTLVVTGDRVTGADDCRLDATGDNPAYLYVDYIRG